MVWWGCDDWTHPTPGFIHTHPIFIFLCSLKVVIFSDFVSGDNILSEFHEDSFRICTLVNQLLRPLIANSVTLIKVHNYSSLFKLSKRISGWSPSCIYIKKEKVAVGLLELFLSIFTFSFCSVLSALHFHLTVFSAIRLLQQLGLFSAFDWVKARLVLKCQCWMLVRGLFQPELLC